MLVLHSALCSAHSVGGRGIELDLHELLVLEKAGHACAPAVWPLCGEEPLSDTSCPALQSQLHFRVGGTFIAEDEALQHSYHFLSVPSNSQGNWSS